jgi:hypothetical protein
MNFGPHGIWYLVGLLPLLALLGWWYYRHTVPEVTPGQRRALLALRTAALLLLAVALARPVFTWERTREREPVWVRLVDYSASMDRPDGDASGKTRLAAALEVVQASAWDRFASDVDLQTDYFADSLAADTAGMAREGTDPGAALEALAARPHPPAAVILLSDGTANASTDAAARDWPFPVYSICFGDSSGTTDRALVGIDAPAVATAGDSVAVRIRVMATGDSSASLFTFRAAGRTQSRRITLDGGGRQQEVTFTFRPDSSGLYKIEAELPALPEEASTANNTIETRVFVEPRRRRALLLADSPTWETAFLARRFAADDRLQFSVRYRALAGRAGYTGWPATYDSLAAYDLIAFADLPPARWEGIATQIERCLRERGAGVLFCIGPQAAKSTWTDLQARLAGVSWRADPPGVLTISEPVHLTEAGRYHPVALAGGDAETAARVVGELPLLSGVVPAGTISGSSVGLVDLRAGMSDWPVIVAGQLGRGRMLTMLGYPIWRWDFAQAGTPGKDPWAGPFWRAAARWLTTVREGQRLTVQPAADPLPALTAPDLSAVLVDESWQPQSGATVTAEITAEDGTVVQTFDLAPAERGRYRGVGRPLPAGDYHYSVRARVDTLVVAEASGRLATTPVSREQLWPGSRPALLDKLAATTGGERFAVDGWSRALTELPRTPARDQSLATLRLWDRPWLLVVILMLLGFEWILRRRFQML